MVERFSMANIQQINKLYAVLSGKADFWYLVNYKFKTGVWFLSQGVSEEALKNQLSIWLDKVGYIRNLNSEADLEMLVSFIINYLAVLVALDKIFANHLNKTPQTSDLKYTAYTSSAVSLGKFILLLNKITYDASFDKLIINFTAIPEQGSSVEREFIIKLRADINYTNQLNNSFLDWLLLVDLQKNIFYKFTLRELTKQQLGYFAYRIIRGNAGNDEYVLVT